MDLVCISVSACVSASKLLASFDCIFFSYSFWRNSKKYGCKGFTKQVSLKRMHFFIRLQYQTWCSQVKIAIMICSVNGDWYILSLSIFTLRYQQFFYIVISISILFISLHCTLYLIISIVLYRKKNVWSKYKNSPVVISYCFANKSSIQLPHSISLLFLSIMHLLLI